jgi:hypothetical protein
VAIRNGERSEESTGFVGDVEQIAESLSVEVAGQDLRQGGTRETEWRCGSQEAGEAAVAGGGGHDEQGQRWCHRGVVGEPGELSVVGGWGEVGPVVKPIDRAGAVGPAEDGVCVGEDAAAETDVPWWRQTPSRMTVAG